MAYQLYPPVKTITYHEAVCDLNKLHNALYTGADGQIFAGLPEKLMPEYKTEMTGYCYRIGQVSNCAVPDKAQGYILRIEEEGICVTAMDAAGLRYGIDTLCQIINQAGESVTCLEIQDHPTVLNRGLMLDVSRGKVYTRDYLLNLVQLLSKLRYNVFQLYMEHPFDFKKHPEICEGSDPITAEDITVLQDRCRELGIELQANLQCLGHFRRILTRPEHMNLSESDMFWSLCTTSEDSLKLLDDLFSEFLPLFDSEWLNICFDEPYDIGKGQSAHLCEDGTLLYIEFLQKVHALAAKYGKKIMLFGDVVIRRPEFLSAMPKDIRYIDWCYDPKPVYGTPAVFGKYGLDYWVSPGSGNWNTLFPRLDGCLTNINNLVSEGIAANAGGMLFTDWNDHGGYTQPAAGYYAYCYAAIMSWSGEPQKSAGVDAYVDKVLNLPGYAEIINTFAQIYHLLPIWSKNRSECVMALFDEPIFGKAIRGPEPPAGLKAYDLTLPEGVQTVLERHSQHPLRPYFSIPECTCTAIAELAGQAKSLAMKLPACPAREQFFYQADAFVLMTDKLALSRKIIAYFAAGNPTIRDLVLLEDEVRVLIKRYVHLQMQFVKNWLQIAHPSEIDISMVYFAHIIERLDYLRDWMSLQRDAISAGREVLCDFSDYETAGYGTLPTY